MVYLLYNFDMEELIMASNKRSSNWFIAGLCAFIAMCIYGLDWFVNVLLNKIISLVGGSTNVEFGVLTTVAHFALIITILVSAWCFVSYNLKRKPLWVILYAIFAILVILGAFGLFGVSPFI